ncbi:MAG: hypothetical protein C4334_09630 [Pyrinomonas sp.]
MTKAYLRVYEEAPHSKLRNLRAIRARFRLSPLNFRFYAEHRWLVGQVLYERSRELAEQGDFDLAAVAARTSLRICPTSYIRVQKFSHLLKMLVRFSRKSKR